MNQRMKLMLADKVKSMQLADSRLQDVNVLKKEIDRWKEEVKVRLILMMYFN